MSSRVSNEYRIIQRKGGKTMVVRVEKVAERKLDLCPRHKRRENKRVRIVRGPRT